MSLNNFDRRLSFYKKRILLGFGLVAFSMFSSSLICCLCADFYLNDFANLIIFTMISLSFLFLIRQSFCNVRFHVEQEASFSTSMILSIIWFFMICLFGAGCLCHTFNVLFLQLSGMRAYNFQILSSYALSILFIRSLLNLTTKKTEESCSCN
jgi:hypothetical protein